MILRNAIYNVAGLVISVVAGLIVSPIVVKSLGSSQYGIWVLVVSLTGQMGLLDLGVQSAVLYFVARHVTTRDYKSLNRLVSTAMAIFAGAGVLVLLITGVLSFFFGAIFDVPLASRPSAQTALWLSGIGLAIGFPITVFNGVLAGLQRYDVMNIINAACLIVRSVATVLVLRAGHGIAAVAGVHVAVTLIGRVATASFAFRLCPELRVLPKEVSREATKEIFGYASLAFLIHVALQLSFYCDSLVIGIFISTAAVTTFAIAGNVVEYLRQFIGSVTRILNPAAAGYEAREDKEGLRRLLILGTRNTLVITFPLLWFFGLRGGEFIGLWMGAEYGGPSGNVLLILLIGQGVALAMFTADALLYGTARLGYNAKLHLWEGITNLVLSVILVQYYGVYGVALGTTIPLLFFKGIMLPRFVSKVTGASLGRIASEAVIPALLGSLPFGVLVALTMHFLPAASLFGFLFQAGVLFTAYAVWAWFVGIDIESKAAVTSLFAQLRTSQ